MNCLRRGKKRGDWRDERSKERKEDKEAGLKGV